MAEDLKPDSYKPEQALKSGVHLPCDLKSEETLLELESDRNEVSRISCIGGWIFCPGSPQEMFGYCLGSASSALGTRGR